MKVGCKSCKSWKIEGFSLIEISIALLVIGIMAGGVLKGRSMIIVAQAEDVKNDVVNLRLGFSMYKTTYGVPPGDDPKAKERFGEDVNNGNGDGIISGDEAKNVIPHLMQAGVIKQPFNDPKIGGKYSIVSEEGVSKILISNDGKGCLPREKALAVVKKITESIGGDAVETDPKIAGEDGDKKYLVKVSLE
jgi:prepilin-type N-terminal cleavage/methylation domain-containing protein